MNLASHGALITMLLHMLLQLVFIFRVLLRPHRQPASRIAWVAVILAIPIAGMLIYLFFGEISIGRRRIERMRHVLEAMPEFPSAEPGSKERLATNVPEKYQHLFRVGLSISHFEPIGGNSARLLANSNAAIDSMVTDIDAAQHHVHLIENNILFYDPGLSADVRQRQQDYITYSHPVYLDDVIHWPVSRRLWNNSAAMFGPLF